ncbi:hypothetical protein [Sphingomonas sp.]|uniref:hypothetical protein n=1 Tax=Sphingomonas sp. TaxID=28214 RepID=UPI0028AB3CC4|nr:hypothetical protein [Sphingomonas sp.]
MTMSLATFWRIAKRGWRAARFEAIALPSDFDWSMRGWATPKLGQIGADAGSGSGLGFVHSDTVLRLRVTLRNSQ